MTENECSSDSWIPVFVYFGGLVARPRVPLEGFTSGWFRVIVPRPGGRREPETRRRTSVHLSVQIPGSIRLMETMFGDVFCLRVDGKML